MRKILLLALLVVGCDYAPTEHTHHDYMVVPDGYVFFGGEFYNIFQTTDITLNYGKLLGEIPPEIGNLTNLTILNIHSNFLTGDIPSEIGNLENLTKLHINNNQLTSIPESFCDILSWSLDYNFENNKICGELPSCLTAEQIGTQDCD